jgi:hypothetical protein
MTQKASHFLWEIAIVIVDESLKRMLKGLRENYVLVQQAKPPQPFRGGYQDFIPYDIATQILPDSGPPRSSAFDDVCHYIEKYQSILPLSEHPESCMVFVYKMIASEYVQVLEYLNSFMSHLAWVLSRRDSFQAFSISWIEQCWSDLLAQQRRTDDHRQNVAAALRTLRASQAWKTTDGWMNPVPDFEYLDSQFDALRQKCEALVAAFGGLADIVSNRRSLMEARSASVLAFVGTIFVPMSLIASILSLPNDYRPMGPKFYQYWVISLPIVMALYGGLAWFVKGLFYSASVK